MATPARLNGRYTVLRPLGDGGGGAVYLVRDEHAGCERAVKVVASGDPGNRALLLGEFRRLATLAHPRLVRVFDLETVAHPAEGFAVGTLFFTAEHVPGIDAATAVREARDRVGTLLAIAEDVAAALEHVHAAGLLHCDVKPANVLVDGGGLEARATLLDLGLSAARGVGGEARGTLAYMSPEALGGAPSPRSDLYGLGATLFHAATGHAPFGASAEPTALIRAICDGAGPVAEAGATLPAGLADLIDRLLAVDPADRPSSAAVVLDELAQLRDALGLDRGGAPGRAQRTAVLPPVMIGRGAALAALERALAPSGPTLVRVVGPAGVGRHSLIRRAVQARQLEAAAGRALPVQVLWGDPDRLAHALGDAGSSTGEAAHAVARYVDRVLALAARVAASTQLILVIDAEGDERGEALARAVAAGDPAIATRALTVVALAAAGAGDESPHATEVSVEPLDAGEVAQMASSMLGRPVPAAFGAALTRATGGLPRLVAEVVREVGARRARLDDVDPARVLGGVDTSSLVQLVVRRVAALPAADAAVLEALAVHDGTATVAAVAATLSADAADTYARAASLAAAGFAVIEADEVRLPSPAHAAALHEAIPSARRKALHRAALGGCGDDPIAMARHVLETGPAQRIGEVCRAAARALSGRGRPRHALALLRRAIDASSGRSTAEARVELAELALAAGDYPEAEGAADAALRTRDPALRRRAAVALARAALKTGKLEVGERALASAGEDPLDDELVGLRARILVARGAYAEAAELAGEPGAGAVGPGVALRLEAGGLAALYAGRAELAAARFEALAARAGEAGDAALLGRALGLGGMVAQARGDIATAATLYERAAASARAASDLHAAAVHDLNRASAHAERGRHGAALDAFELAMIELRRLGDVPELAAAEFNRGIELLAVGETEAAGRAAERAGRAAERHDNRQVMVYARLLAGDVRRRERDLSAAMDAYRDALARAGQVERDRLLARLNLAEALAEAGDRAALTELEAAAADVRSGDDRDRSTATRARVLLALGDDAAALGSELDEARRRMRATGRVDQAWRADVTAARIARQRGDDAGAAALVREAAALFDDIERETPEARRRGLIADPDARWLASLRDDLLPSSDRGSQTPARGTERDLRRLLSLGRRLNSELRLAPLLDQVIDTVIDMTSAERGFLLLFRDAAELEVVVARNFDQSALAQDELVMSRSIAERAARSGEVVLTVDAAFDERFGTAASVAAMRLRSVLAVPLRQKGRVIGTVYVDHRFRSGAFDDSAVELVRELADLAAIAIENARLVEENNRREREIAELNRRLEDEVVEKETELATVKARLPGPDRAGLRHAYDAIVGRSPAMMALLRMLDRATDTELPVVVFGESGTGKELVARALHENGRRRGGAFVAINCGAVPEQLLESELFGHVRGSFTGADRDRRGLFEVADGGTLFLDEVADTSLAMQAKLLRVLQEGEIRRVGDHRTRKVDVRLVTATNRPLEDLVAAGQFREDLFYRVSVMQLTVPPLRERVEDIPALAAHILARMSDDPPALTRAALARLAACDWPGNVRELENELARASALAEGAIDVDVLSPRLAEARAPRAPRDADDLALKPRVEALERELVEQALERTSGNQTAAARLLGLSRFGLQKKLKRYGIAGSV